MDIQFPLYSSGILTCAINTENDKIYQGALRLRKLGVTQKVVVWAEEKTRKSIKRKLEVENVTIKELLMWITLNTIETTNRALYYVTSNSINFEFEKISYEFQSRSNIHLSACEKYLQRLQVFKLETLYAYKMEKSDLGDAVNLSKEYQSMKFFKDLQENKDLFEKKEILSSKKASKKKLNYICDFYEEHLPRDT